jgi:cytochrome d ubiquinol oxidase subunit I
VGSTAAGHLYLMLQFNLPIAGFPSEMAVRAFVAVTMLSHMFFAQLFVGYAIGSPLFQWWGKRKGNPWMLRLSNSMARFNILTFSWGATLAGLFIVLIWAFYPRVTSALWTHFYWFFPAIGMGSMLLTIYFFLYIYHYRTQHRAIWAGLLGAGFILIWQTVLTGMDTFMVAGPGPGQQVIPKGVGTNSWSSVWSSMWNPMWVPLDLHRTVANLSWPAFAVAAWAAFMYARSKSAEDKAYFDWAGSMGVIWGAGFLLLQPFLGFAIIFFLDIGRSYHPGQLPVSGTSGPYDRLVGTGGTPHTFTSDILFLNLIMVVGLFVLSNAAMYLGANRHPERYGRNSIRAFGIVALLAGLYSISPVAEFPVFWARYVAILIMILATFGTLIAYVRGRRMFEYGSPGTFYRVILMSVGTLAAVLAMSMGWMKSNSRVPYTIYGSSKYQIYRETPVTQHQLQHLHKRR